MLSSRSKPTPQPSLALRYGVAVGMSLLALLLTFWLSPFVERTIFIFFFAALAVTAWYGGVGPAVLIVGVAVIGVGYRFVLPADAINRGIASLGQIGIAGLIQISAFVLIACLITGLIEARRRSEQQRHAQGERFRITLASIGDAVIVTDTLGLVTFMNAVAEELTGWPSADALGQPITTVFQIVNEMSRQPVESPVLHVLRDGRVVGLANHTVLIARDGTEYPIADSGAPIRDLGGAISGVVLVFRDVSEAAAIEQARDALFESEQASRIDAENARSQLSAVLDRINDAFMALDTDWRYEYVNQQATRLTQHAAEDLLGKNMWQVFPDLVHQPIYAHLHRAVAEQVPVTFEQVYTPFNILLETRAYPSPNGVTVYFHDITAEQQAKRHAAQLHALTAALSAALTPAEVADLIVQQGIAVLNADAGLVAILTPDHAELEIVRVTGYPPTVAREGQRIAVADAWPLSDAVRTQQVILVDSKAAARERYPELNSAQDVLDLESWASIPLLLDGHPIGALDMSFKQTRSFNADDQAFLLTLARQCAQAFERARLYEAEQQSRQAAEHALQTRDQFLSLAAHELKTPLTALLGHVQLLQRRHAREELLQPRDERTLQVIEDQANRLNKLVMTLLDISRIETGQLVLEQTIMDLDDLVRRVVDEMQPLLEGRPITVMSPRASRMINGDPMRLEQVFQNLIQNAVKYSSPLDPIMVTLSQENGEVRVAVRDTGIGIPQTALTQLFERFFRATNAERNSIPGMGIGLYVVKEIVSRHAGHVHVESQEGAGSTFTVCLPLSNDSRP